VLLSIGCWPIKLTENRSLPEARTIRNDLRPPSSGPFKAEMLPQKQNPVDRHSG